MRLGPFSRGRLPALALACCLPACSIFASSPAAHSPLKDRLAAADTSRVEDAARACLTKQGWKVDPVGGLSSGGANVVTASKAKNETNVYIQAPEVSPRVTGGPDYDDPFWSCLGTELAGGSAPAANSSEPAGESAPEPAQATPSSGSAGSK